MKYRTLNVGEIIEATDAFDMFPLNQPSHNAVGGSGRAGTKVETGDGSNWYRPIPSHNWIKFSDRHPAEADGIRRFPGSQPQIVIKHRDGSFGLQDLKTVPIALGCNATHWMAINFIPDAPEPVKVEGRTLVPQKNGDVKISCGTVIPKADVDEFIRQRQEVMK